VGDRYQLRNRQRMALARAACADQALQKRQAACVSVQNITDADLIVDGFNLLITIEAALGGGVLLRCRDGCIRDLASVHGTYRSVEETLMAIQLVGDVLQTLEPRSVEWLLDQPVSNSGRLAQKIRKEAKTYHWPWKATVVMNPDTVIMDSEKIAVSSDSSMLDHVHHWVNLSVYVIVERINQAWVIDLREEK
jgi:hypothetical protein